MTSCAVGIGSLKTELFHLRRQRSRRNAEHLRRRGARTRSPQRIFDLDAFDHLRSARHRIGERAAEVDRFAQCVAGAV